MKNLINGLFCVTQGYEMFINLRFMVISGGRSFWQYRKTFLSRKITKKKITSPQLPVMTTTTIHRTPVTAIVINFFRRWRTVTWVAFVLANVWAAPLLISSEIREQRLSTKKKIFIFIINVLSVVITDVVPKYADSAIYSTIRLGFLLTRSRQHVVDHDVNISLSVQYVSDDVTSVMMLLMMMIIILVTVFIIIFISIIIIISRLLIFATRLITAKDITCMLYVCWHFYRL